MSVISSTVDQSARPDGWQRHRFGLSEERWEALKGKSFWITGAGSGYGRCISVALGCAGAQVFLTGRRRDKLIETVNEIRTHALAPVSAHMVEADLTNLEMVEQAAEVVRSHCDTLHGLVNNAAIAPLSIDNPLQEGTLGEWERIIRTNLTAPWMITREIYQHMKSGGQARVLFVTSEAGWAFTPGFGDYNVSKAALNSLSASFAQECALSSPGVDVQINALVPGEARTEMNQNSTESPYTVVSMALLLLSHPRNGPNGNFFHRDGRHLQFAYSQLYDKNLI